GCHEQFPCALVVQSAGGVGVEGVKPLKDVLEPVRRCGIVSFGSSLGGGGGTNSVGTGALARPGRPKDAWFFAGSVAGTFVASGLGGLARGDAARHGGSSKSRVNLSKLFRWQLWVGGWQRLAVLRTAWTGEGSSPHSNSRE